MEHSIATYFRDVVRKHEEPSLSKALESVSESQLRKGKEQLEKEFRKELRKLQVGAKEFKRSDILGSRFTESCYGTGIRPT